MPVAEGSRYLLELDSKEGYAASSWHTDVTFVDAYPKGSILRAITIPEAGGDRLHLPRSHEEWRPARVVTELVTKIAGDQS